MRQSERSLAPTPSSRALVPLPRRTAEVLQQEFAVRPPLPEVLTPERASSRKSRWFSILAVPMLFAAGGYFANDPDLRKAADYQMALLTSGGISVAGVTGDSSGDAHFGSIPRHAFHLFGEGRKGPRADRYLASYNATAVAKTARLDLDESSPDGIGVQRTAKGANLLLASGVAVQDEEAARPENSGLMANASFFLMPAEEGDGVFNALAPADGGEKPDMGWDELRRNASLSPEKVKTIFGGLTEEEFRARELQCMATAVYFESRGEPYRGQVAVGQVIMNRIRSPIYPKTICGVVYQGSLNRNACQFSFACDGKRDRPENKELWASSVKVAKQVIAREAWIDEVGYSTHYHADYVSPDWRHMFERVAKVGVHIFYKPPKGAVQVALIGE